MIVAAQTVYARERVVANARVETQRAVRGIITGTALGLLMWLGIFALLV